MYLNIYALPCIHFLSQVTGDMKNCNSRMYF